MFVLVNGDAKAPATDYLRLRTLLLGMTLGFGGCTTYGVVENFPLGPDHPGAVYALSEFANNPQRHSGELMLAVAFSGGGTRAAALSYGVMQELRDTQVQMNGKEQSLLDAITVISSVSGGQFHVGLLRPVRRSHLRRLRGAISTQRRRSRTGARLLESRALVQQPRTHSRHTRLARGREEARQRQRLLDHGRADDLSYQNKVRHKYAQLVDGGITDNLGLRALLGAVDLAGGAEKFIQGQGIAPPRRTAIISVNAAADAVGGIGESRREPTFEQTMNAVTNVQLHRYNVATLEQTQQSLDQWTRDLSTPERPVSSYFIRLSFEDVPDVQMRRFLNEIPTSFVLDKEQVARLIATGRELLRNNPDYQRLLTSLHAQPVYGAPTGLAP